MQANTVLVVAGFVAVAFIGCGDGHPETAPVAGKVTYKGQPVTQGTVTFYPADGRSSIGKIKQDGTYTMTTFAAGDGALLGEHRVTIKSTQVTAARQPASFEEELALGDTGDADPPRATVIWLVPQKYSQRETTPQSATVTRGDNRIDFALTDE